MERFDSEGGTLEYRVDGTGPPLLLLHGSVIADPWGPMLRHGGLADDYQVITYRRRGYGGSSGPTPGHTLRDEAADAVALLDHLGVEQAHVVGHSLAADIVLQAALDAPSRFATLALIEPGLFSVPSGQGFDEAFKPVFKIFESGDHRQAMLLFLGGVGGEQVMAGLERELPQGTAERALAAVPTLFGSDIPAGSAWELDEEAARLLSQPTLLVLGEKTGPIFRESNAVLADLLPNVEHLAVKDAGHFVHIEQAEQVAQGLATFLKRNTPAS